MSQSQPKCSYKRGSNKKKKRVQQREISKKDFTIIKSRLKNKKYSNDTTLSKYIWDTKEKHQETPTLKWSIVKQVPSYSNITKKCLLCLHEKFEILNYPNPVEMLNKRSELISKCRHSNKFLLKIFKSNDWSINKLQKHVMYEILKDWLVSVV